MSIHIEHVYTYCDLLSPNYQVVMLHDVMCLVVHKFDSILDLHNEIEWVSLYAHINGGILRQTCEFG